MKTFTAMFNTRSHTASVHADGCRAARNTAFSNIWTVEAETAAHAAADIYTGHDFEERGMPMPKICRCTK